jgi:GH15 family glucan-1,4-alpha-glucosidase
VKHALIGNCSYQALIDDRARVQWLCWPRFDSSFVFGSLLDDDAGEFSVSPPEEQFTSTQDYVPRTNILRTVFNSESGGFEVTDFAPRFLQFERSFKPTMLVRRVRPLSGTPLVRIRCNPVYDYGETKPSTYTASNHIGWSLSDAQLRLTTNAPLTYVREGRPFALDKDIFLVLTWGLPLEAPLVETCQAFLSRTQRYWETWVKHANIPDRFQDEVIRSALALKLHQYEDTGAITAAATTSIPEYPGSGRTWDYRFCWLRDSCFTLGALRRLGHFEEMERFVGYLTNIAATDERLQPVYGISGESVLTERTLDHLAGFGGEGPVRAGNQAYEQEQHDVYGEMLASIAPMFSDVRFRDHAGKTTTTLLDRLLESIDEHMEAPDAGLWEKRQAPVLHTFSLLMHWVGATAALRAGERGGNPLLAARARKLAARARSIIEDRCWRESLGRFADSPSGDNADASLLLLVNTGFLDDDLDKAARHIHALHKRLSANDALLYRYRHDDGLGDTHATFTVCGFWYAEALARVGEAERAEEVFRTLLGHANHVGLLSEDIDPDSGQLWGNFPQTYSHVGVINTAFALSSITMPMV